MGFSCNIRVGSSPLEVYFVDHSEKHAEYRKWVFGDGSCYDGETRGVSHVYTTPGVYSVTLIRGDSSYQESESMENLIYVNEGVTDTFSVIAESGDTTGDKWRLGFDRSGRLFFESKDTIRTTDSPHLQPNRWSLVEYHVEKDTFYIGMFKGGRKLVGHGLYYKGPDNSLPQKPFLNVAPNSSMTLGGLKIWGREADLSEYFKTNRGTAGYLDPYL